MNIITEALKLITAMALFLGAIYMFVMWMV